jgi:hypothetical protein
MEKDYSLILHSFLPENKINFTMNNRKKCTNEKRNEINIDTYILTSISIISFENTSPVGQVPMLRQMLFEQIVHEYLEMLHLIV